MARRLTEIEAHVFEVLSHLRYLSTDQVRSTWFPDRATSGVSRRLRRLRQVDFVASDVRLVPRKALAWRLRPNGIAALRELRNGDFRAYRPVRALFLEHLLDTNRVWLTLAGPSPRWPDVPFRWTGSHRAQLPFVELHEGGRRRRALIPDALVESPEGPRVFLELDRSSERITRSAGQRSIQAKLAAYRQAMVLPRPNHRESAYAAAYADSKKPRIAFVMAKDPKGRRRASILRAAAEMLPEIDVRCVPLNDPEALRAVLLGDGGAIGAPERRDPRAAIRACATYYREMILCLKRVGVTPGQSPRLRSARREAHAFLSRNPDRLHPSARRTWLRFVREADAVLAQLPRARWPRELREADGRVRRQLGLPPAPQPKHGILEGDDHEAA